MSFDVHCHGNRAIDINLHMNKLAKFYTKDFVARPLRFTVETSLRFDCSKKSNACIIEFPTMKGNFGGNVKYYLSNVILFKAGEKEKDMQCQLVFVIPFFFKRSL